jgi:alpha-galactosidase
VPVILRPFHEASGSWFWWGGRHRSAEEYQALWRFTVEYLRDKRRIHNVLYAYSPDVFDSTATYLASYPGDAYVDVLGLDDYQSIKTPAMRGVFAGRLHSLVEMAEARGKIPALTETGVEGIPDSTWWTGTLLAGIKSDTVGARIAWVLVWRNANHHHFYAPFVGHPSAPDFVKFRADPLMAFQGDVADLYHTVAAPTAATRAATTASAQKFDQLALTPPMGWNSWNKFGCNVSEALIRETADAMVASGMQSAGYQYVNIDDCWHGARDSLGFIHPDPQRFPSGMRGLADYVHAKGLKLGIYSDAGSETCGGRPGSRGYEAQDALTYARWGVDYVKYDWCHTDSLKAVGAYLTMRDALYRAGRPVVFSICEWGESKPWTWGAPIGHLWRTTGDIHSCFDCIKNNGTWSSWGVMEILDKQSGLRAYAGPGHWNDPDMLEVGNGMSVSEDRAHFSMWSMLAAPMIAGNDLRHMSAETARILTNRDVVAVDQDSLGTQGFRYSAADSVEVWFKPLVRGAWAMAILNRGTVARAVAFDWARESVADSLSGRAAAFGTITYRQRDLWTGAEVGTTARPFTARVPAHDVLMMRLTPTG